MSTPLWRLAVTLVTVLLGLGARTLSDVPEPAPPVTAQSSPDPSSPGPSSPDPSSPGPSSPVPSPELARLVTRGHAPAAALLAGSPTSSRFLSTGPGIGRADHFRAGSITKTFIATVVLQLDAEGRLDLDDPVRRHLPGLLPGPSGHRITLRTLLTHTSGLPDYTTAAHGIPAPRLPISPVAAVRSALAHPLRPPGSYAYSNTNYAVLGLVVEQVTGHSYAAEVGHRIITPLRLTGTSFPGARTDLPAPHGRAYDADGRDVTALDPRTAGAAGELISTLADLNRFYAALLGGRLLPPAQLRELLDTRPAHGTYGMGIYPRRLSCGTVVWGHNGHITGSYVRAAATADGRRALTFRVNTDTLADGTLTALEPALLDAEFCGASPAAAGGASSGG
ncbi:serine hydrolase domain-containing protein [Streptomyces sp. NPDC006368]|uniref:serine hydrolase domain-containing protein n=1 Tax=Streptomyces sp. NPDC006368 TaxID=3156760 RepID=UPI0033AC6E1C